MCQRRLKITDYNLLEKFASNGIRKIIGNQYVTQDNIDKVVSKIIANEHKFNPEKGAKYTSFIFTIVKNVCFSITTNVSKKKKNFNISNYQQYKINIDERNRSEFKKIHFNAIEDILDKINESTREKIIKIYYDGMSYRKVAELYGISNRDLRKEIRNELVRIRNIFHTKNKLLENYYD
jgi:RNA polymerase sigma factor (sigma-70 family)